MSREKAKAERVFTKDIWLVLIASFFYMASPMLVTPIITGFSHELGASGAVMGLVGGMMNLCSLFCRPIVGNLTDRVSKYRFGTVGTLLMTFATLGYVLAPNMAVVVVSRLACGVGFACCSVCMSTWMSDMLPRDKIGSGMGLYGTMNAFSMAIGPSLGVALSGRIGYRPTLLLAALFSLGAFACIQFVKDKGLPVPRAEGEKRSFAVIDRRALPVAIIVTLFALPYCATQSFLVSYAEGRNAAVSTSLFFPVYALVLLVLRLSLKSKFDKWPYGLFLLGGGVNILIALVSLTFMQKNGLMFLAAAAMAGSYGIMCSVSQATAILLAGPGRRGLANSTYYVGIDLGMTLGPFIGGMLYAKLPIEYFYPSFFICLPAMAAVYLIWQHKLKKTGK